MNENFHRFAIYWAPPKDSPLMRFGNAWLGRDPESEVSPLQRTTLDGWSNADLHILTAAPRRYGFHATLKPPFRLAEGVEPDALLKAVARVAAKRAPFDLGALKVTEIGSFIALVPADPPADLSALAAACVRELDMFRAPLIETELARRRQSSLTPCQLEHLDTWGYPYVLDEFRFHLTLSGKINDAELRRDLRNRIEAHLSGSLGALNTVDEIAVFGEPFTGADFRILRRFGLGATTV